MATADRYLQRGDFKLHVRHSVVDQNGPTYVLLHGWSGNYTCFEPLVALLNARGINTVVPDLRGHGLSSKHRRSRADYQYSEYVADLRTILDALELKRVSVLGYSAGGTIALHHELSNPGRVDQLILIGSNHDKPYRYWHIPWAAWPAKMIVLGFSRILKFQKKQHYKHIDLVKIKNYWGSVFEGLQSMPYDVNLWLVAGYSDLHFGDELRRIQTPALVIRGAGDPFFTQREARDLTHKLSKARLVTVPEAGHYLVTRHSEELLGVLEREGALPHGRGRTARSNPKITTSLADSEDSYARSTL